MNTYKILALNGSPRGRKSNTDLLLKPFLEGAEQAGAQTEIVYSTEINVKIALVVSPVGKTPGICAIKMIWRDCWKN